MESDLQKIVSSAPGPTLLSGSSTAMQNGNFVDTKDKVVLVDRLAAISIYNQWVCLQVSGPCPLARYQHAAAIIKEKMYIVGGNHNGRYLNDVQVLDLKTLTWSKVEKKSRSTSFSHSSGASMVRSMLPPCAGHSLIQWSHKLLLVAGYSKHASDTVEVSVFDSQTCLWSSVTTYGSVPIARGGQSVTLVGSELVMFGGEDWRGHCLNDLNVLHLETMTWEAVEAVGTLPSPRSGHTATVQTNRFLLIFGGGAKSTCFNDLHLLDLETMEWSQPEPQGILPMPRSGHAGVTIGDNWYIIGGGDNNSGICETVVLNMPTLVWSVAIAVQGQTSIVSEGLSTVAATNNGEEAIVAFGGYNGRYCNEVHVMKIKQKAKLQLKILESPAAAAAAASVRAAFCASKTSLQLNPSVNAMDAIRNQELPVPVDATQATRLREVVIDNSKLETLRREYADVKEQLTAALRIQKDLEVSTSEIKIKNAKLKHEVAAAQTMTLELLNELQFVRAQLAAEQSRCFPLEVEVAELRQKLQCMESMQDKLELLHHQKPDSKEKIASVAQKHDSRVWSWFAGAPAEEKFLHP